MADGQSNRERSGSRNRRQHSRDRSGERNTQNKKYDSYERYGRHDPRQNNLGYGQHGNDHQQYNRQNNREWPSNRGRGDQQVRGGFGHPPGGNMNFNSGHSGGGQGGFPHGRGGRGRSYPDYGGGMDYRGQQGGWGNMNWQQQQQFYPNQYGPDYRSRDQRRHQRDEDDTVFISKTLSYILRHGAEKQGFQLMKGGFLYVDEILRKTQKLHGVRIDDVERIVKTNDKQRFALETDEKGRLKIRANQGHTMEVDDLDLEEITAPEQFPEVIHGTYYSSWEIIKNLGLSRMNRNHVHFAPGEPGESGVISGMRKTCEVLIYIDMEKALKDGLKFYRSANNVILCPGDEKGIIYPCYFSLAVIRNPRQKLDFDNTITKDTVKHEPKADAGKYANRHKQKQTNTPVGMQADESGKKKKKKKRKKNKETDDAQTEPDDAANPAAKKQATEEQKGTPENWDDDAEGGGLDNMFDEDSHQEDSEISQEDSKADCQGDTEKMFDQDAKESSDAQPDETNMVNMDSSSFQETTGQEYKLDEKSGAETCQEGLNNMSVSEPGVPSVVSPRLSKQPSSSLSSEESVLPASSALTAPGGDIIVISDVDSSISAVDTLLERKQDTMAVCCYGNDLGTERSKICLLVLVTDKSAYAYDVKEGNDDLIKRGHVKQLFEDPDIEKVFNKIGPQSLSLAHDWDILLDGTPVSDVAILYEKCFENLSKVSQNLATSINLTPDKWDDSEIMKSFERTGMINDMKASLVQRGRNILKLFSMFKTDQKKTVKRDVYEAAAPKEGFMADKIEQLKKQRKEEKQRQRKEEKSHQGKQQAQSHGSGKKAQSHGSGKKHGKQGKK